MDVQRIIREIDTEIAKLQEVRGSLAGISGTIPGIASGRRGRPKGSKNAAKSATKAATKSAAKTSGKRRLSPEGRKAIAEAMKRRWAERRKEAGKKETAAK